MPDQGRGKAFVVVFVMCCLQVFAKVAATALLAITNGTWLLLYLVGDHAVHLAYHIARRDLVLYMPMPPVASYPLSTISLILLKVSVHDIPHHLEGRHRLHGQPEHSPPAPEWGLLLVLQPRGNPG